MKSLPEVGPTSAPPTHTCGSAGTLVAVNKVWATPLRLGSGLRNSLVAVFVQWGFSSTAVAVNWWRPGGSGSASKVAW